MFNLMVDIVELILGGIDFVICFGMGNWLGLEFELFLVINFVVVGVVSLIGDCKVEKLEDIFDYLWL